MTNKTILEAQAEALEEAAKAFNLAKGMLSYKEARDELLSKSRQLRAQAAAEQPEVGKDERENYALELAGYVSPVDLENVEAAGRGYIFKTPPDLSIPVYWKARSHQAQAVEGRKGESFQARVEPWLDACFGHAIATDPVERNHRFVEEALELSQACGCTASEAHQLVDYVWGRPVGEKTQEVGGVMVTLAALCSAWEIDMAGCGEVELARIWTMVEKIRAKQAAKPKHSPLAEATPPTQQEALAPVGEPKKEGETPRTDAEAHVIEWGEQEAYVDQEMVDASFCRSLELEINEVRGQWHDEVKELSTHRPDSATPSPQAVPEGFVLVPREPTEEMVRVGDVFFDNASFVDVHGPQIREIYAAMLAVVPKDQQP